MNPTLTIRETSSQRLQKDHRLEEPIQNLQSILKAITIKHMKILAKNKTTKETNPSTRVILPNQSKLLEHEE